MVHQLITAPHDYQHGYDQGVSVLRGSVASGKSGTIPGFPWQP